MDNPAPKNTQSFRELFVGYAQGRSSVAASAGDAGTHPNNSYQGFRDARYRGDKEDGGRVQRFGRLFSGYRTAQSGAEISASARKSRFVSFTKAFVSANQLSRATLREVSQAQRERFRRLVNGHTSGLRRWEEGQVSVAERFGILEVLELTYDELTHCRVLAWLLDRQYRHYGTHAQGRLGFRLFLAELGLSEELANCEYFVKREVRGKNSRIDVEVAARGHFLMHIEVKILAAEGTMETTREWADMKDRAQEYGLGTVGADSRVFPIYLTPSGRRTGHHEAFRQIGWKRVARVLKAFAAAAQPPDVKLFASHYARTLERFVIDSQLEFEEVDHGRREIQRG